MANSITRKQRAALKTITGVEVSAREVEVYVSGADYFDSLSLTEEAAKKVAAILGGGWNEGARSGFGSIIFRAGMPAAAHGEGYCDRSSSIHY